MGLGWWQRLRPRVRSRLRQLLWLLWPAAPATWAEVPSRLRPAAVQITRLTLAGVISYLAADTLSPGIRDLTAPLTALLVVQASTVGTLQTGLVRVAAVLTGVLVAIGLASYLGLTWWSLAAAIVASLVVAKLLRLGDQTLEAPISAMLILAVSTPELAAETRVVNTLIGTTVGIGFSLLVPVAIPNQRASDAVRRVARSQAALLDEVALTLGDRAPHPDEARAWVEWAEHIGTDITDASSAVATVEQSRRLNPRALAVAKVHPGLRSALDRLDRCLAAERALLVVIAQETPAADDGEGRTGAELRSAFAVVLDDLATGLRAFADVILLEYGTARADQAGEARRRVVEVVAETRAVLTELLLLDVDPRAHPDLWMLQGSVLAAVEQVLSQLDLEHEDQSGSREAWLTRHGLPLPHELLPPVVAQRSSSRRA